MQLRFETSHLHAHTKTQEILRQQLISINGKSMNLLSVQSANTPQKKKKKKKSASARMSNCKVKQWHETKPSVFNEATATARRPHETKPRGREAQPHQCLQCLPRPCYGFSVILLSHFRRFAHRNECTHMHVSIHPSIMPFSHSRLHTLPITRSSLCVGLYKCVVSYR